MRSGIVSRKWVSILAVMFIMYAYGSSQYRAMTEKNANPTAALKETLATTDAPLKDKATDVIARLATSEAGEKLVAQLPSNGPLVKNIPTASVDVTELQSLDSVIGEGKVAASCGQAVSVHYSLFLPSGSTLDSTRQSNNPVTFMIGKGQVIRGLEQGVVGMKAHGIRKLTIPPGLAYDDPRFATKAVPKGSVIKAEVELLTIIPAANRMASDINCK